jgi:hypothetical protein
MYSMDCFYFLYMKTSNTPHIQFPNHPRENEPILNQGGYLMDKHHRLQEWTARIADFKASGLTMSAWCEAHLPTLIFPACIRKLIADRMRSITSLILPEMFSYKMSSLASAIFLGDTIGLKPAAWRLPSIPR